MAFEVNEFGRSIAAPGLVIADQPYTTGSRVMAEDALTEGGFPVYGKKGEDVNGYAAKPETDGYFLGVAQRIAVRDEYPTGTPVTVVTSGQIWVKVEADVSSGNGAYITTAGGWGASGTAISNATYRTSAKSGGYAVIELK